MDKDTTTTEETQEVAAVDEKEAPERQAEADSSSSRLDSETKEEVREKKGGPDPFFAAKRHQQKLDKRLEKLEQSFAQTLEYLQGAQPKPTPSAAESTSQPTESDIWTDPNYVKNEVRKEFQTYKFQKEREDAEEYILSQEDIDPDKDYAELQKVIKERSLDILAAYDPWAAAELTLEVFRARKGISKPSKLQAMGVQGSPAIANGKKIWTRAEIERVSANSADFEKYGNDIMAALEEGRVKL